MEQNNEIGLSKKNDNNNNYLNLNQNDFPTFKNICSNFNTNNEIKQEFRNNNSNIEGNENGLRYNFNKGDNNFFSAINNYNNYFINNNNNTQTNFQYNNLINSNDYYSPNNSNIMNYPQVPSQPISYNYPNNLLNQNLTNNYYFNNNSEIPTFNHQNQFQYNNQPLFQVNKKNNNKHKKKKVFDEYITYMFGRRGWICDLCNNFNFESRKKCNRCQMLKKPRKIDEFYQTKLINSLQYTNYCICKYCGNYNYPFRLACNRCQAKK